MERLLYAIRRHWDIVAASVAVNLAVLAVLGALVYAFGASRLMGSLIPASWRDALAANSGVAGSLLSGTEDSRIISVVKRANPAVVSIVISKRVRTASPVSRTLRQEIGGGSGFLVTPDGLVVTNRHVVDDPEAIYTVYTYDGKHYPATVAAKDPTQDIAILKIAGQDFSYLPFADSGRLELGQTVIAIGNVFDQFKNSVSVGVVSGLSRSIVAGDYAGNVESLEGVIQTDAAINPGNSGGPLLDGSGKVVGVNVATARGSENVGFALPSNTVRNALLSVMRTGKIMRPYLGIRYVAVNQAIQDLYHLPYGYGALITAGESAGEPAVMANSPAAKAGLEEGDVVLEIDGKKIEGDTTVGGLFLDRQPGDIISLRVWHAGSLRSVKVKLAEYPLQ